MLGKPYIAPEPCLNCAHTLPHDFDREHDNAFEACFEKHLTEKDSKMDLNSDFMEQFLFDSSFSPAADSHFDSPSSSNHDGNESTPATQFSPASSGKLGELDLDGFTPGVPTFSLESTNNSDTSSNLASTNYFAPQPSSGGCEAITPGKTMFDASFTAPLHSIKELSQIPASRKPILSIQPPRQANAQLSRAMAASAPMQGMDPLIDPALYPNGLPSSTSSAFSPVFSQPGTEPPSAIEPQSAISHKAGVPSISENEKKSSPKRKRARKTDPTSPADVEKQARFLERNRNAASRCRARRKAQNDRLEQRAGELERDRDGLRLLHQSLLSEKATLLERILELSCDDACNGAKDMGHLGQGSGKPPKDLLVSALGEIVMGHSADEFGESIEEQDAAVAAS